MTTTVNLEHWHVAMDRYTSLLRADRALLTGNDGLPAPGWEQAQEATSAAVGLLIDTPARSLVKAAAKLRVIIRHAHLEGPSDDIDDQSVRDTALSDPMRDGAWPLLRILEDLESLLPPAGAGGAEELRIAARRLEGWEAAERHALDAANAAEEAGESDAIAMTHLSGLDALLKDCVVRATAIRAVTVADLRNKSRILQVLTRGARWGDFELEPWEEEFIASIADDAANFPTQT